MDQENNLDNSSLPSSSSAVSSPSSPSSLNSNELVRDRSSSESSIGSNDSILLGLPVKFANTPRSRAVRTSIDLSSMNLDAETINQNLDHFISPGFANDNIGNDVDAEIDFNGENSLACSVNDNDCNNHCLDEPTKRSITSLNLSNNRLTYLPSSLSSFVSLTTLDISENGLDSLKPMVYLPCLTVLIACNNKLTEISLSKADPSKYMPNIKVLSLSGNQFRSIPETILDCVQLRSLYLGANLIESIPKAIAKLTKLRYLYLGGNQLTTIPEEVGLLSKLEALSLCENKISSLPSSIAQLSNLRSLALHMNLLTTLPTEIIRLESLTELSLRNNPLVVRFINDYLYNPPSLLELAGRCIKINRINYPAYMIPQPLHRYLQTAQHCVNPQCQGVYFDSRIEQIKFVDFCGSYRLPLLQYLCSPKCSKSNSQSDNCSNFEMAVPENKMKRVLLG
ncbi:leucine-rich repeat-containing protein 58 [Tetranychus urticae]|uniref:Disease resistance R13L4/SHOC-2-like LRR domain-containing protein n=1 Tax=Tetranychus urticae TaxID=32264 RepID=T1L2E1_TETUR|nr:leucine-rich repeat-containing protein 58 [Tetranychus urticae]XP_015793105.1 leucine-rich repeat-containing protein 58 [Tetranychus urticae]XP_015793106.1 leucine-rich repeat-containing protein 58 [Tetranychus urticae]XP_015793107.1 leucine-rich repeat-containing protein 58 [Tetranychus urticae]XP_015793109.1 leucine-rich repeat-containing protein 58 [Tetranychus urticae]XP_015793110.1 leucine-rich repeat-containing protein 58 [Tetranychus urticae]XP_025018117.1 leucine-rich repeat-contai